MHCRHCEYALWNIRGRTCPECGAPFQPSSYEFQPGTVAFCCPHCDTARAGDGEDGQPETPRFACTGCGREIRVDESIVRPIDADHAERTRPGDMPWLERRGRGVARAYLATIGAALLRPRRLAAGIPADASVGEAVAYAVVTLGFFGTIGALVPVTFAVGGMLTAFYSWWQLLYAFMMIIMPMCGIVGIVAAWAMLAHLSLRLGGARHRGIDRTLHAFCYASGAGAIGAVPCIGPVIGIVWWMVSATVMLQRVHRTGAGRAVMAVLALPICVVVLAGVSLGIAVLRNPAATTTSIFSGGAIPAGGMSAYTLGAGIQTYAWQSTPTGAGPEHVIEIVVSGSNTVWTPGAMPFCDPSTQTKPADVPLGPGTLADFAAATASGRMRIAASVVDAMPANVLAYRVGDFVFTYPGVNLSGQDPNTWLVIMLPEPDVNPVPAASDTVYVATGAYTVHQFRYGRLAIELKKQNAHRATLGLPALPDPATVTHGKPAVSSGPSTRKE